MRPVLISFADFKLFSYPLLMGIAWGLAFQICKTQYYKKFKSLKDFSFVFWGTFVSSWVGAKVFYLINSAGPEWSKYAEAPNFWLGGGFVFYGGLIFGLLYLLVLSKFTNKFSFNNAHLLLPGITIGHAIGRIGCLLAGCCYGVVCDLPISVYMRGAHRHPVQLYESIFLFALGFFLLKLNKIDGKKQAVVYFMIYGTGRFLLEFLRGDSIRGFYGIFSSSQLVSVAIVLISILLWIIFNRNSKIEN